MPHLPPTGGRETKAKDNTRMETEAERGAGGGGAKTPPQLRGGRKESGAVTGVVEGRTVEYGKADGESRRGAGDDAAEGWIEPHTGDEGAAPCAARGGGPRSPPGGSPRLGPDPRRDAHRVARGDLGGATRAVASQ